jgi:hypothetical protein
MTGFLFCQLVSTVQSLISLLLFRRPYSYELPPPTYDRGASPLVNSALSDQSGNNCIFPPSNKRSLSRRAKVKYGVRSPNFIWAPVYSCTHWLRPCNSPPPLPPHLGSYTRALLVIQDRRHLFVTPCRRVRSCVLPAVVRGPAEASVRCVGPPMMMTTMMRP